MEKLPKAYEKEYMKMAMLKHEQTFKQQVNELHRLYRTQKALMKNAEKSRQSGSNPESLEKRNEICFRQIYEQQDAKKYYRSKLDLEQPAEGETEANNNGADLQENELELTLGPPSYNNTSDSGVTQYCSSSTGSSHEGSPGYQQNGTINRGEKKMLDYPPWLFQVVSLNMT